MNTPPKEGDHVRLLAIPKCEDFPDGLPEEFGVVEMVSAESQTCVVQVQPTYREGDDCVREVSWCQIEPAPPTDFKPPQSAATNKLKTYLRLRGMKDGGN